MKIVLLSYHSGIVHRGAETFCDGLASNLSGNHEITVFQSKNFDIKKKYKIITINANSIFSFTLKSLSKLTKIKPDIIIPINGRLMSLLIKLFTLLTNSKLVISGQAGLGIDEKWNLFLRPDLFVSLSKRNDKWIKNLFPHQKTTIIPNGVDLGKFKPQASEEGQTKSQSMPKTNLFNLTRPIILCIGGPEKFKRVEGTIKAVSVFTKQNNKGSLIVLGGSNKTQILGQKLLGKNFKQTKVSHDKLPEIYNSANLFTLASESSEAFGISYLEALASNLPVVATDDSLRREIIDKAGLFIKNPENSQEYSEKLKQALEKNWGNLPRLQAEKFSWSKISSAYESQFQKLIQS